MKSSFGDSVPNHSTSIYIFNQQQQSVSRFIYMAGAVSIIINLYNPRVYELCWCTQQKRNGTHIFAWSCTIFRGKMRWLSEELNSVIFRLNFFTNSNTESAKYLGSTSQRVILPYIFHFMASFSTIANWILESSSI
jgi:hypothetical protein